MTDVARVQSLLLQLRISAATLDMAGATISYMQNRLNEADARIQCLEIELSDLRAEMERR